MSVVRVARPESGPRVWIFGCRVHHGMTGLVATGVGVWRRNLALTLAGAFAVADDLHDFPWTKDTP